MMFLLSFRAKQSNLVVWRMRLLCFARNDNIRSCWVWGLSEKLVSVKAVRFQLLSLVIQMDKEIKDLFPNPNQNQTVDGESTSDEEAAAASGGESSYEVLRARSLFHHKAVYRRGQVVIRETGTWTVTVHSLLRHLEDVGFAGAPRVVGSGFDAEGRETLSYIEGEFMQPGPWTLEGAGMVGQLLRELHEATASYRPPSDAIWGHWFGRSLGGPARVIGHSDIAALSRTRCRDVQHQSTAAEPSKGFM
jgi:hypothetical protein